MDARCISREEYVFFAKLSELAERYDEMARFMDKVVVLASPSSGDLTVEERNLLSAAYKNLVGGCRAGWRILSHIEQREEGRKDKGHAAFAKTYRGRVESDLASICDRILGLLDSHLIPSAGSSEAKVFYLKMKGDYNRYIAEYKTGAERQEAANCAMAAYQAAQDIALSEIPPSNPLRLGVALNYSVFYFEILHSADDACATARQAFYAAVRELDSLGEESNKDSALIVQLLRENLNLWSSAEAQEQIDEA